MIESTRYQGKIVSDSKVSNIIHNEIVQNIAENPLVICDVSSKNPNVMFELGLRLAFDKPTIVIKDDDTNYNFDTSPTRHLGYPKDLRHSEIVKFKLELKEMILATDEAFKEGKYITFLQSFTKYKPKLIEEEVDLKDYFDKKIDSILKQVKTVNTEPTLFPNVKIRPLSLEDIVIKYTEDYIINLKSPRLFFSQQEDLQTKEIISYLRKNNSHSLKLLSDDDIKKIIDENIGFYR